MQSLRAIFETLRVEYANIYQAGQELFKAASPMDRTQVLKEFRFAFEEIGDLGDFFLFKAKLEKMNFYYKINVKFFAKYFSIKS